MRLFRRNRVEKLSSEQLLAIVTPYKMKHEGLDPEKYAVALRVAGVLGCDIFEIIGYKPTDEKILTVLVEMRLGNTVFHELAEKYRVYKPYMMNQMVLMQDRIFSDKALQEKIIKLERAFFNETCKLI